MATMLGENSSNRLSLSTLSMRSLLDGIYSRLDESRDLSRYTIGLLIFLGLLGTFWGLLGTVASIGSVIANLSVTADATTVFSDLKAGLEAPLTGMGTAFSSSLFGLAGSLVLGFLDLQVGQASNRFFNELEDWLSQMAIFTTSETGNAGLSEAAVESLAIVAKRANQNENEKVRITENINDLSIVLNRLVEKLDEDRSVKDHLITISTVLKNLGEQNTDKISELQTNLTIELRAISKQLSEIEKSSKKTK